jgi:hypothetical protein
LARRIGEEAFEAHERMGRSDAKVCVRRNWPEVDDPRGDEPTRLHVRTVSANPERGTKPKAGSPVEPKLGEKPGNVTASGPQTGVEAQKSIARATPIRVFRAA